MPRLSVWFIRTALLNLGIGFLLGAVLLANKGVYLHVPVQRLLPMHGEALLIGGMVQFAMGVAFWMLPRFRSGPERGAEGWGWLAYLLINGGVILAGSATLLNLSPLTSSLGRAAELLGAASFGGSIWRRIKPFDLT